MDDTGGEYISHIWAEGYRAFGFSEPPFITSVHRWMHLHCGTEPCQRSGVRSIVLWYPRVHMEHHDGPQPCGLHGVVATLHRALHRSSSGVTWADLIHDCTVSNAVTEYSCVLGNRRHMVCLLQQTLGDQAHLGIGCGEACRIHSAKMEICWVWPRGSKLSHWWKDGEVVRMRGERCQLHLCACISEDRSTTQGCFDIDV